MLTAIRWARDYCQYGATEYLREFEDLTLARVFLAEEDPAEALALLDALLSPAEAAGRGGRVIEILVLQALARQAQGDPSALETLGRALELGEPEGYVRTFIDQGAPMALLLHHRCSAQMKDDDRRVQFGRQVNGQARFRDGLPVYPLIRA